VSVTPAPPESGHPRRALIVTGEASGDLHGASLIRATRVLDPGLSFFGVGGEGMAEAGCEIIIPGATISVMGIVEVIGHLGVIRRAFNRLKAILSGSERPDLLILIDFPDFNLRLAAVAKRYGIPVLYYVSPQVWAWRRGRVKKIAAVVDRLAAILPFEPPLYAGLDIDVEYVGNPLTDQVRFKLPPEVLLTKYGIDPLAPVIGIFPGSRHNELRYNLQTLVAAGRLIRAARPEVRFLIPAASTLGGDLLREQIAAAGGLDGAVIVDESIYDVAASCRGILAVSGTVTLQTALVGTPLAIVYRMAPLTYAIGKRLVKVPFIGLPNIIAGQEVAREFIQEAATPTALAQEMLELLRNPAYEAQRRTDLDLVREKIGPGGCSERVALMASEMSRGKVTRGKT